MLDRLTGDQKGKGASLQHVQFDEARVDKFCAGKKTNILSLFFFISLSFVLAEFKLHLSDFFPFTFLSRLA